MTTSFIAPTDGWALYGWNKDLNRFDFASYVNHAPIDSFAIKEIVMYSVGLATKCAARTYAYNRGDNVPYSIVPYSIDR